MTRSVTETQLGFTLLELMITVVIVALLATIALPGYREYVLRTHRTAAKSFLTDFISRQESYRADRKAFATTLVDLGLAANPHLESDGDVVGTATSDAIYAISLEGATASDYTVVATPEKSQADDTKCGVLKLSATGSRSASGTSGIECWER